MYFMHDLSLCSPQFVRMNLIMKKKWAGLVSGRLHAISFVLLSIWIALEASVAISFVFIIVQMQNEFNVLLVNSMSIWAWIWAVCVWLFDYVDMPQNTCAINGIVCFHSSFKSKWDQINHEDFLVLLQCRMVNSDSQHNNIHIKRSIPSFYSIIYSEIHKKKYFKKNVQNYIEFAEKRRRVKAEH